MKPVSFTSGTSAFYESPKQAFRKDVRHIQKKPSPLAFSGNSRKGALMFKLSMLTLIGSFATGLTAGISKASYEDHSSATYKSAVSGLERLEAISEEMQRTDVSSPTYHKMLNDQTEVILDKIGEEILNQQGPSITSQAFREDFGQWLSQNSNRRGEGYDHNGSTPDRIRFEAKGLGQAFYELSKDHTINSTGDIKKVFDIWVSNNINNMPPDNPAREQFVKYGHEVIDQMDWHMFVNNTWGWTLLGAVLTGLLSFVGLLTLPMKSDSENTGKVVSIPSAAAPPPEADVSSADSSPVNKPVFFPAMIRDQVKRLREIEADWRGCVERCQKLYAKDEQVIRNLSFPVRIKAGLSDEKTREVEEAIEQRKELLAYKQDQFRWFKETTEKYQRLFPAISQMLLAQAAQFDQILSTSTELAIDKRFSKNAKKQFDILDPLTKNHERIPSLDPLEAALSEARKFHVDFAETLPETSPETSQEPLPALESPTPEEVRALTREALREQVRNLSQDMSMGDFSRTFLAHLDRKLDPEREENL